MYIYKTKLIKVVDGDTMDLSIDLGFRIVHNIRVRLLDIDTPEVRGVQKPFGLAAKEAAEMWFNDADRPFFVETKKTGKYGRWLARIFYRENEDSDKIYLHDYLKDLGFEKSNFLKNHLT
jgi:micrococcal nuclease